MTDYKYHILVFLFKIAGFYHVTLFGSFRACTRTIYILKLIVRISDEQLYTINVFYFDNTFYFEQIYRSHGTLMQATLTFSTYLEIEQILQSFVVSSKIVQNGVKRVYCITHKNNYYSIDNMRHKNMQLKSFS